MLGLQLRWHLNVVLFHSRWGPASSLALQSSDIRSKDLLGNVDVLNRHWAILDEVLAENVLEILGSGAPDHVIESAGPLGISKLSLGVPFPILAHTGDGETNFGLRVVRVG